MGRKIGYARVSTNEQELDLPINALVKESCDQSLIFKDQTSGAKSTLPRLDQYLDILEPEKKWRSTKNRQQEPESPDDQTGVPKQISLCRFYL